MKRGLIVCRTGMGSCLMLRIKVDQVIRENGYQLELVHDALSGIDQYHDVDVVITMNDLVPEIKGKFKYCIGIENILDKEAIKNKLDNFFAEQS